MMTTDGWVPSPDNDYKTELVNKPPVPNPDEPETPEGE
jgi:hypothetical protein